ncbi:unnamed protein product [Lymnaea stagnalis]|uniref:FAM124 domain-containing protein n=1 Tax=Lymnaea stagnalis TaxID=6523 RepID=A0AAV2IND6_LYMST
MSSPALAVILFLPEFGVACSQNIRRHFQKFPWRHHHTIQLQKTGSASVLGKHEFYFLSRQLPLWSVCTSLHSISYVRFNLFVRRFNAMVEFYRLITGAEMESRKPGFSLFTIGTMRPCGSASQPQSSCELALKYSPQVSPYPLTDAYLTFPVHDLHSLLTILPSDALPLSPRDYLVRDPDGNVVILHEVQTIETTGVDATHAKLTRPAAIHAHSADKASVHSDSIDSGRYSDFDVGSSELDQCMTRLAALCKLDATTAPPRLSKVNEDQTFSRNSDRNHCHPYPVKLDMSRAQNPTREWSHAKKPEPHSDYNPQNTISCFTTHEVNDKASLHYLPKDHTQHSQSDLMRNTHCSLPVNNASNFKSRSVIGGQVIPQHCNEPKHDCDCYTSFSDNVTGTNLVDTHCKHFELFPEVPNIHISKRFPQSADQASTAKCRDVYPSAKDNSDQLYRSRMNHPDSLTSSSTSDLEEPYRTRNRQTADVNPPYKVTFV